MRDSHRALESADGAMGTQAGSPLGNLLHPLFTTGGRKLKLLQAHDPLKQWWSLDEMRFCAKCQHLFLGRDIRFLADAREVVHFRCPTFDCPGGFEDWQYPELHL